jgi:hypothetical protein
LEKGNRIVELARLDEPGGAAAFSRVALAADLLAVGLAGILEIFL